MKCPKHDVDLVTSKTKYGTRWTCFVEGCTVRWWGGKTSTPADQETCDARIAAHAAFDPLWKSKVMKRGTAYKRLSIFLDLHQNDTHIGMFDEQQCKRVLEFVEQIKEEGDTHEVQRG